MPQSLNTYETRLLDHLHTHLASQPVAEHHRARPRRATRIRRASLAAVLATVGGITAVHLEAQPAWAVTPHADGIVTVTVNRTDGADGARKLQQRLHELGIQADVQFPADGQQCADDRMTKANELPSNESQAIRQATLGSQKVSLTVDSSRMPRNATLVLEVATLHHISATEDDGMVGRFGIIRGQAPACHLIPLTSGAFTSNDSSETPPH